jgi:hypothetical protein
VSHVSEVLEVAVMPDAAPTAMAKSAKDGTAGRLAPLARRRRRAAPTHN